MCSTFSVASVVHTGVIIFTCFNITNGNHHVTMMTNYLHFTHYLKRVNFPHHVDYVFQRNVRMFETPACFATLVPDCLQMGRRK